jgi:hypothetical protein
MIKRIGVAAVLAGAVVVVNPLDAQQRGVRPVAAASLFELTPYAGYMVFGDLLTGPVGTRLSAKSATIYGVQLGMHLAPSISLVGNVAHSSTDLEVGVPVVGGIGVGRTGVWLYDGSLQVDLPVGRSGLSPVTPFVQVGAGAMRYDLSAGGILNRSATNVAFNVGAGLNVHLSPTVGLSLMAKDYIGKPDLADATGFDIQGRTVQSWALTAGVRLGF